MMGIWHSNTNYNKFVIGNRTYLKLNINISTENIVIILIFNAFYINLLLFCLHE